MLRFHVGPSLGLSLLCAVASVPGQSRHFEPDASRAPAAFFTTIDAVRSIVCGDLDGDGRLDVVHAGTPQGGGGFGYYVTVLLRRGNGWLEVALPAATLGFVPRAEVELIDFDGDGDPDLLVRAAAIPWGRSVAGAVLDYFRNDGGGAFTRVRTTNLSGRPGVTTAAADLDGDGDQDLVVGLLNEFGAVADQLVLARHDGAFGFVSDLGAIAPVPAYAPVLLDLDADGDLDLLALDEQRQVLRFDNQNGAFVGGLPVGTTALSMCAGDLDGDGDRDVVLQRPGGDLALMRNTGGALTVSSIGSVNGGVSTLAAPLQLADVDGDADLDLLVPGYYELQVWRNDGLGGFPTRERLPGADALGQGDFDGDGRTDLVVLDDRAFRPVLMRGAAGPLRATADTAQLRGVHAVAPNVRQSTTLVDLDRDGLPDVVSFFDGDMAVRRNTGGMVFDVRVEPLPFPGSGLTVVADVDADGDDDVVVRAGAQLYVLRSDGGGALAADPPVATGFLVGMVAGDLDGDGDDDLVAADFDRVYALESLGASTGAPVALPAQPTSGRIHCAALGDVDRDGDVDVIVGSGSGCMQLLTNDGAGAFTNTPCAFTVPFVNAVTAMLPADVDGDGDEDLLVCSYEQLALFSNDGAGGYSPSPGLSGSFGFAIDRLHAADLDEDGDLDFVTSGTNHSGIWINDGAGQFTQQSQTRLGNEHLRRALVVGDLDGDGDVDFLRSNEPELFDNVRALATLSPPYPGGALRFAAAQNAGFATVNAFVLPVLALQTRAPLRVPGIAGLLQVDPAAGAVLGGVLLPAGSGRAEFQVAIPLSPNFVGLDVFVQGLVFGAAQPGWTPMVRERVLWR